MTSLYVSYKKITKSLFDYVIYTFAAAGLAVVGAIISSEWDKYLGYGVVCIAVLLFLWNLVDAFLTGINAIATIRSVLIRIITEIVLVFFILLSTPVFIASFKLQVMAL